MIGNSTKLIAWLMGQSKEQLFELKEYKEKRTLTQNALYWKMVGELSRKIKIPSAQIHNMYLRDCGQIMTVAGKIVTVLLPDTETAEKQALASETLHLRPTSQIQVNSKGTTYRVYIALHGSHEMTVEQMSRLVDLALDDAKANGIETIPPNELQHIRELERSKECRKKCGQSSQKT